MRRKRRSWTLTMTSRGRCGCKWIAWWFPGRTLWFYLCFYHFPFSYQQALSAVQLGQRKLEELNIPITRPDDYFAEMVKTDDHMRKVCCCRPESEAVCMLM